MERGRVTDGWLATLESPSQATNHRSKIEQWLQQVAPQFTLPACRDTRFLESMNCLRSRHMEQRATDSVVTAFEERLQVSCQEKGQLLLIIAFSIKCLCTD
jgi:hypothetical protein